MAKNCFMVRSFQPSHRSRFPNESRLPALLLRPARGFEGHVEYAILEVRLGGLRVDTFGERMLR